MSEGDAGLGGGLLEGVEIDDDHIDGLDAVSGDGGFVLGVAADVEEAAVDAGVERFDAAVEHFGEAGEVADVLDGEAGFAEGAGGAAGGDELDAEAGERFGEIDEAGLICHAEQRPADGLEFNLLDSRDWRIHVLTNRLLELAWSHESGECKRAARTKEQTTSAGRLEFVRRFAPTGALVQTQRK